MLDLTTTEYSFITESNKIERINRPLQQSEIEAFKKFMKLKELTLDAVCDYVYAIEPTAKLRYIPNCNVTVGDIFVPPPGGPNVPRKLGLILEAVNDKRICPWGAHVEYETLHPFTDGNGRSGRMIWWWMTKGSPLGFLHSWYYMSLENARKKI